MVFVAKHREAREARGEKLTTRTDAQNQVLYQALKSINPQTDGASALDVAAAHIYYAK